MQTRSYRWLAAFIFLGGLVCLGLTATMNFLQGEALGVTDAGKWVNSISSVVVDVVGLLFMGLAAGACIAARRWPPAVVFSTLVAASAVWSVNSMVGFQAGERLSAAELYRKAGARDTAADKLLADNASWFTRMTRNVGRSARRDYIAAATDSAKEIRSAKVEARIDPQAGTKVIAKATQQDVETVAIGQISYLALLLILLKAVSFPSAAWLWAPLAVRASPEPAQKNSGGSSGSSDGSGGSGKAEPRKPELVHPPKRPPLRAEPANVSSARFSVSTDAPKGKLTYEQLVHTLRQDMAHGDLASSTRALARQTGWSQTSVVRQARRLRDKANTGMRRYAGNGGGRHSHVSAMG